MPMCFDQRSLRSLLNLVARLIKEATTRAYSSGSKSISVSSRQSGSSGTAVEGPLNKSWMTKVLKARIFLIFHKPSWPAVFLTPSAGHSQSRPCRRPGGISKTSTLNSPEEPTPPPTFAGNWAPGLAAGKPVLAGKVAPVLAGKAAACMTWSTRRPCRGAPRALVRTRPQDAPWTARNAACPWSEPRKASTHCPASERTEVAVM
mmetsp:Transcript_91440/g.295876  ORF Transcript_91440/g.295876 Transcript_91440/m.295876 type:complete len:204 (+) Transcript_91440:2204-2815(+)